MEYAEFRQRYEARNPASVPVKRAASTLYPQWLRVATLVMFFSSALLSGVHTVPVVRAGIPASIDSNVANGVSLTAFISVEMAIFISAFALVGGGSFFVRAVLLLATVTALAANIYSVLKAYLAASMGGDVGTLVVAVIIGIVAPGIAFLSGKMFVDMHKSSREVADRADLIYRKEAQAWDERIGRAWDAYQDRVQAAVREADALRTRQEELSRMASNPASIVRDHLSEHPEHRTLSARELAALLNVGKSTAATVKAEFPSSDGQSADNSNGAH